MSKSEIAYADALAELESILAELEADDVDVDVLAARVKRANELVRVCRDRIEKSRLEVEQIVADLDDEYDDDEEEDDADDN